MGRPTKAASEAIQLAGEKTCSECKRTLSLTSFYFYHVRNYLDSICKRCKNTAGKGYRKTEKGKLTQRKVYNKQKQRPEYRFSIYKTGAKKRGLSFGLSLQEFKGLMFACCNYCGGFSEGKNYCGIDRVDNKEGYILSNCAPCCDRCNEKKNDLSVEQFYADTHCINAFLFNKGIQNTDLNRVPEIIDVVGDDTTWHY